MPRSGHYLAGWRGPASPPRTVLATLDMTYPKSVFDVLVHDPTITENFIFYPTHTTHTDHAGESSTISQSISTRLASHTRPLPHTCTT